MSWALFIDDERFPKTPNNWKIARTSKEAFELIEKFGAPNHISFDHDLGEDIDKKLLPTAYDFAKELGDKILDGKITLPKDFTFNVHSANPVGAENIKNYMNSLLKHINS